MNTGEFSLVVEGDGRYCLYLVNPKGGYIHLYITEEEAELVIEKTGIKVLEIPF